MPEDPASCARHIADHPPYDLCIDLLVEHSPWEHDLSLLEPCWFDMLMVKTLALAGMPSENVQYECSFTFMDDASIAGINRQYRGKDYPTNILSFPVHPLVPGESASLPIVGGYLHLGDCLLAYETVHQEAEEQHVPLPAYLAHLIVHGILHLLGYDHETESEAQQMEALETRILQALSYPSPYVNDTDTNP